MDDIRAPMLAEPTVPSWPNHIRAWRKLKGLSRMQLATAIGVTPSKISGWERGDDSPRMDEFVRAARCLRIGQLDLLRDPGGIMAGADGERRDPSTAARGALGTPGRAVPAADVVPFLDAIAARAAAAEGAGGSLAADVEALGEAGMLIAPLDPDEGGRGLGTTATGAGELVGILREIGRANLSLARLYEGHVNAVKLVALYAEGAARGAAFEAVRAGSLLGVWGADGAVAVTMAREGEAIRLDGSKRFASGLGLVDLALVFVATDDGPQLLLLPVREAARSDAAAWRAAGMRATASGTFEFAGMVVGSQATIGRPGDVLREPHFEGGVWRYCAAHLGGAEALYDLMLSRLCAQGRAGDPHQEVRIVAAACACETARLWIERAAARVEGDARDPDGAVAYSLLAREATEHACLCVIDAVERALGTAAHMTGDPVERIRRDLGLFLRQAAPDAKRSRAARALVARQVRAHAL